MAKTRFLYLKIRKGDQEKENVRDYVEHLLLEITKGVIIGLVEH